MARSTRRSRYLTGRRRSDSAPWCAPSAGPEAAPRRSRRFRRRARRVAIKRRNAVHRMTSDIVKNHSANLVTEELQVQSMTAKGGRRKRGLNRSMREQSLGLIVQQLAYKAESAGGKLVTVSPHNTTQQCSRLWRAPRQKYRPRRSHLPVRPLRPCLGQGMLMQPGTSD